MNFRNQFDESLKYIIVNDLKCIFYSDITEYANYENLIDLHNDMRFFLNRHYKNIASFGHQNGNIILVNVANVTSFALSPGLAPTKMNIQFDTNSISIQFSDSTDAQNNFDYLDFIYKNYDPVTRAFSEKTAIIAGQDLDTIQDCINFIGLNNYEMDYYVRIPAGRYDENLILLDSVDLFFEDGAILLNDSTGQMMTDDGESIRCSIYGDGIFEKLFIGADSLTDCILYQHGDTSEINFSFKTIYQAGVSLGIYVDTTTVTDGAKLRLKGNSMLSDNNTSLLTTEGSILTADIDVLTCVTGGVIAGSQKVVDLYRYIRNCNAVSYDDFVFYSDSTSGLIQEYFFIINSALESESANLQSESKIKIQSWGSLFHVTGEGNYAFNMFNSNYYRSDRNILHGINGSNVSFAASRTILLFGELTTVDFQVADLSTGKLNFLQNGLNIELLLNSIPFVNTYEIYNRETLLDTVEFNELKYNYTIPARVDKNNFYRFRYRGKTDNDDYTDFSNSVIIPYYKGAVI